MDADGGTRKGNAFDDIFLVVDHVQVLSHITHVSLVLAKAIGQSVCTDEGISTYHRFEQFLKADGPIVVTDDGMEIDANAE